MDGPRRARLEGLVETMLTEKLTQFFESLGQDWVLYLLLALFLLALTVMVERLLFFRRNQIDTGELSRRVIEAVKAGGPAEARVRLRGLGGMTVGVLHAALDAWDDGVDAVEEVVQAAITRERTRYDKRLAILGTLGNSAPFIGLLGTVIGILTAFSALGGDLKGATLKATVMSQIGGALVATAVGLAVAIPCVVAFNAFKSRIRVMASNTEDVARMLLAYLKARRPVGGPAPTHTPSHTPTPAPAHTKVA